MAQSSFHSFKMVGRRRHRVKRTVQMWSMLFIHMHGCKMGRGWHGSKLHQIWYLVSPILIVLLNTICKQRFGVTNT